MRFRITIALLLANIVVFGAVYHVLSTADRSAENAAETAGHVFNAEFTRISVDGPGVQQPYTLESSRFVNGEWNIVEPYQWGADAAAVRQLCERLRAIKLEGSYTVAEARSQNNNSLDFFGLDKPDVTLSVTPVGTVHPTMLKFGRVNGERVYLLIPAADGNSDNDRIVTLNKDFRDAFVASPDDTLRSKSIFTIEPFEVVGITVHTAGSEDGTFLRREEQSVVNSADIEQVWRFESPFRADADKRLVNSAITRLVKLPYLNFLPAPRGDSREFFASHGLGDKDKPLLRLTLNGSKRSQTLLVGKVYPSAPAATPAYYARLEKDGAVKSGVTFTISEAVVKDWSNINSTLREEQFLQFAPRALTEITITDAAGKRLVLHRRNEVPAATSSPTAGASAAGTAGTAGAPPAAAARPQATIPARADTGIAAGDIGEWTIAAPETFAADPTAMRDLIETLRYVRAQTDFNASTASTAEHRRFCSAFVSDKPTQAELSRLGFDKPARRVDLVFAAGSAQSPRTLLVAAAPDDKTPPHAKLATAPSVYSVRRSLPTALSASPAQYRHRLVASIPVESITALKITNIETQKTLAEFRLPLAAGTAAGDRKDVTDFLGCLANTRAATYLEAPFTAKFTYAHPGFEKPFPWRYRIEISRGDAGRLELFATKRLDGITQIVGCPAQKSAALSIPASVFKASQQLIDALFPLTFVRDRATELPPIAPPSPVPPAPTQSSSRSQP